MVDTTTIDLPSSGPGETFAVAFPVVPTVASAPSANPAPTTETLPDVATMVQQLQTDQVLTPEVIPQALKTIDPLPAITAVVPSAPVQPIQLASTAPQFVLPSGQGDSVQINTWKWVSVVFMVLSVAVVAVVLISFWRQGMRIQVITSDTPPAQDALFRPN